MEQKSKFFIETFQQVSERVPEAENFRNETIQKHGAEFFEMIDTIDGYEFFQFIQNGCEPALFVFRRKINV